jgi:hypothetical protein
MIATDDGSPSTYEVGQKRRRQPLAQGYALPLFPESDGRQSECSP